jgi:D-alanyl-D-alanine carboxypeptidase/D-alanyl-D-alanine-endopeptidase (penicillin-binding protein 4)
VEAYAQSVGVDKTWLSLDDGSGLSSKNRVAARAFTTVLAHVAQRPDADLYVDSLAVPREEGTLKKRFVKMAVSDSVHAKTGHISGVSALSGFLDITTKDGKSRRIVFSILCNKYLGNVNPWQDQVCEEIYEWAGGK